MYRIVGVCCDYEYIRADMSQYLTDAQKEEYWYGQYKITCCRDADQVRDHIDERIIAACQIIGYPDDKLFTDDDGNLYLIITHTDYNGYQHYEVISQEDGIITARACIFDEDGCYRNEIFTLRNTKKGYQIIGVEEDQSYQCEAVIVDEGPYHTVYKYGASSYGYKLYDARGETKVTYGTDFQCPAVNVLSENIIEISVNCGAGNIQRFYRDMKTLNRSDPYDYSIAASSEKIAFLEGEPGDQTLVVCSIFDRDTARTFREFRFHPEAMPVSEAAFSKDGAKLTLTYHTDQDTEATVTLDLVS